MTGCNYQDLGRWCWLHGICQGCIGAALSCIPGAQVNDYHDKAANTDVDNSRLRGEISILRQSLEVHLPWWLLCSKTSTTATTLATIATWMHCSPVTGIGVVRL